LIGVLVSSSQAIVGGVLGAAEVTFIIAKDGHRILLAWVETPVVFGWYDFFFAQNVVCW